MLHESKETIEHRQASARRWIKAYDQRRQRGGHFMQDQQTRALTCLVTNNRTSDFLAEHDPQALLQAQKALNGESWEDHQDDPDFLEFFHAYQVAALWSSNDESTPEGGEPIDNNYGIEDIDPETVAKMKADCLKFWTENKQWFTEEHCLKFSWESGSIQNAIYSQAGHDFWLTRHHHGVGFWETSDWSEECGELLTQASQKFRETNLYVENGKVHVD